MSESTGLRRGEYARRGEYHRTADDSWEYGPTYVEKMRWVRNHLDALAPGTRVIDIGCGEGVLVDEYKHRLAIEGIDANYASDRIRCASATALPFPDAAFDFALCLDVLEHIEFGEQRQALSEIRRVLKPGGCAVFSFPNLAHLQSRVQFLVLGRLIRTANEQKHPGDRPVREFLEMLRAAGFTMRERRGIFPTLPVITHFIRRHPAKLAWLHRGLTRVLPVPGWCFLNLVLATTDGRG